MKTLVALLLIVQTITLVVVLDTLYLRQGQDETYQETDTDDGWEAMDAGRRWGGRRSKPGRQGSAKAFALFCSRSGQRWDTHKNRPVRGHLLAS
jgi:hypothetical protein